MPLTLPKEKKNTFLRSTQENSETVTNIFGKPPFSHYFPVHSIIGHLEARNFPLCDTFLFFYQPKYFITP